MKELQQRCRSKPMRRQWQNPIRLHREVPTAGSPSALAHRLEQPWWHTRNKNDCAYRAAAKSLACDRVAAVTWAEAEGQGCVVPTSQEDVCPSSQRYWQQKVELRTRRRACPPKNQRARCVDLARCRASAEQLPGGGVSACSAVPSRGLSRRCPPLAECWGS